MKFFEEENEEGIKFNEKILKPNQYGFEKIEFFISPNPGESEKPLIKIASGGELSRVMLSIRTIFGKVDEIPCIVFDEIDQGIGGRVGEMIGRKLLELSKNVQVISITHLPQIASFGDNHIHRRLFQLSYSGHSHDSRHRQVPGISGKACLYP